MCFYKTGDAWYVNATMELNEKGYYFAVLVFGLYAAVSYKKQSEIKKMEYR